MSDYTECNKCRHFTYDSENEGGYRIQYYSCEIGHEIEQYNDLFVTEGECDDFQKGPWYRGLSTSEVNEILGDMEYHRRKDEGLI